MTRVETGKGNLAKCLNTRHTFSWRKLSERITLLKPDLSGSVLVQESNFLNLAGTEPALAVTTIAG
jgi:hypothetical protein